MSTLKKNRLLNDLSGSIGDLGTLLPLAFALIAFNGFEAARLFFLWGIIYLIAGYFFKVPVSVQPLKAMAVIAIGLGLSTETLAATSFFYGILLVFLSATGIVHKLQKLFTPALVKGIQVGIGLILFQKAFQLVLDKGFLLNSDLGNTYFSIISTIILMFLIIFFQFRKRFPLSLMLIAVSIPVVLIFLKPDLLILKGRIISFEIPDISLLANVFILLIIPQLPLTLGNAMFAASDACHSFWPERSKKVSPANFGYSIGLSNIFIGLCGGFPVCHGAGGIAAHKQFGAQTEMAAIIMGSVLIITAIIPELSAFIFFIPVPLLAAMLLFDSWRMIIMVRSLGTKYFELIIAFCVGLISFFTKNLTIALITGWVLEWAGRYFGIAEKFPQLNFNKDRL